MSGIAIEFGIDDAQLQKGLGELGRSSQDMLPLMDEIGGIIIADVQHNFAVGAAPDGTPWKKSRRVERHGGQTLVAETHLRDSITSQPASDQVAVGTNWVYAGIHQMGGKTGRNHAVTLPARPYLGISAGAEDDIYFAARQYLASAAGARS